MRTRNVFRAVVVVVAALFVGGSVPAAGAATPTTQPARSVNGQVGWVASDVLAQHPEVLTAAAAPTTGQLVQIQTSRGVLGWASDAYVAAHPTFLVTVSHSLGVSKTLHPNSYFGCNANVCIDVRGSSTTVVEWYTTAQGGNGKCTASLFDVYFPGNNSAHTPNLEDSNSNICAGEGSGTFYDYQTNPSGYYADKTKLCNGWLRIAGYPCATIRK